jgi:S-adenosylmethionine-diacylglycerol 3-amino-3-carboxypropyl transferase
MNDVRADIAKEVDFSIIRYAQCWEDADVMLEGLDVKPGDVCLSIASAGDNTLSLLVRDPARVVAVDLSASQLACLEIRAAAYRSLSHEELLELLGARPSNRRMALYARLAPNLSADARRVWDANAAGIRVGIGRAGKFERYLDLIRRFAVNVTHSKRQREELFRRRAREARKAYYDAEWNNWRWRILIRLLSSRIVMGRLGRDPRFFRYARDSVSKHIMGMVEHAMVDLDPVDNGYLQWIVMGSFGAALPHALRAENFDRIRKNLDRLEWHLADAQSFLQNADTGSIQRFYFSDVFEYLSEGNSDDLFDQVARVGSRGGRAAYWNMLVPRHRPERLARRIRSLPELSRRLHFAARTFFYTDFVVEEVV